MTSNIKSKASQDMDNGLCHPLCDELQQPDQPHKVTTSVGPVESALGIPNDAVGVRESEVLKVDGVLEGCQSGPKLQTKIATYGSGHVSTSDTLDGCVEVVEALSLNNLRADLAAHAEPGEAALGSDQAIVGN